jgi:very-short-patch-repair endonuclease
MARIRSLKRPCDERIWATQDRSIILTNRIRAREMRAAPTDAERKLWWHLRYRLAVEGTHFRRQVRLGRYIVDFASHKKRLVVELDGGQHAEQVAADARRTKFLQSEGYRVLRYWNNDVLTNIDGVLEDIVSALTATPTPNPSPQGGGE